MLKDKFITRSLCTLFFVAAPLTVAVTAGHAAQPETVWAEGNERMIDWETHGESKDLDKGIYFDEGWDGNPGWRTGYWPFGSMNGNQRYLSSWQEGYQRKGIAFWILKMPKTGFYKLETCYKATENRTPDADYAVYANTTIAEIEKNFPATSPPKDSIGYKVVDQESSTVEIPWVDLGTYCYQEGDISMIVEDGRDADDSDSVDASRWTYVGDKYKSERCGGVNVAPIHHLLLRNKIK
jgi:hypothetical protein